MFRLEAEGGVTPQLLLHLGPLVPVDPAEEAGVLRGRGAAERDPVRPVLRGAERLRDGLDAGRGDRQLHGGLHFHGVGGVRPPQGLQGLLPAALPFGVGGEDVAEVEDLVGGVVVGDAGRSFALPELEAGPSGKRDAHRHAEHRIVRLFPFSFWRLQTIFGWFRWR